MRRTSMALAVTIGAVVGSGLWWKSRPLSVRPGPVRFQLLDGLNRPWPQAATISLDGTSGDESTEFEVVEGEAHVVVRPPPVRGPTGMSCGTTTPFERGTFTMRVAGSKSSTVQVVPVRLGPTPTQQLVTFVTERYEAFDETRTVRVQVELPDGGPADKAWVTCNGDVVVTHADGEASCGARRGSVSLRAGLGEWGTTDHLEPSDARRTVRLGEPSAQLHVIAKLPPSAAPSHQFTIRSKEFSQTFPASTPELFVPALPLGRFIVCVEGVEQACDVVVPPPDGGVVDVELEAGPNGTLQFIAATSLGVVPAPIVYLDRGRQPEQKETPLVFSLSPGRHVLVVNLHGGPERFERIVTIESGKMTDLGTVLLEAPSSAP